MKKILYQELPVSFYSLIWGQTRGMQVLVIGTGLVIPWLTVIPLDLQRTIIDEALPSFDERLMIELVLIYLLVSCAMGLCKFMLYWLRGRIAARVTRALRDYVIGVHLCGRRSDGTLGKGDVAAMMAAESENLGAFSSEALNTPLIEGGSLLLVSGFLIYSAPQLALATLAVVVIQGLVAPLAQKLFNRLSSRRIRLVRRNSCLIVSHAPGDTSPKQDILHTIREIYSLNVRVSLYKGILKAFMKFSDSIQTILVLAIGGYMVMHGSLSLGYLVAFMGGLARIREPWHALIDFYRVSSDANMKYALLRTATARDVTQSLAAFGDDAVCDRGRADARQAAVSPQRSARPLPA
jgi:ABC-type bacteriocin/lantibiotic exporter with double-glycine peptidase domain